MAAEREASMNGANRLKERAALASIAVSALMTAAKFAAGLASGSLAVLSEAGHNLADVATTALTFFAIRIANKPADEEHQFGHAKVEALVALVETGFLFALAVYILIEAIKTPKAKELASIFVAWPASRAIASIRIKTASANKNPVSTRAAKASTLEWPN